MTAPYSRTLVPELSIPWTSLWSVCCCLPPSLSSSERNVISLGVVLFPSALFLVVQSEPKIICTAQGDVLGPAVCLPHAPKGDMAPVLCLVRISCCMRFVPGYVHLYGKLYICFQCWHARSKAVCADKAFKSACF